MRLVSGLLPRHARPLLRQRTIDLTDAFFTRCVTDNVTARRCISLQPTDINAYAASHPPTDQQLKGAAGFFVRQPPILLFSSPSFRQLPASNHPEVTFLGRSNVGKSSLINALFNRHNMAQTSKKPGKTRLMHAYGVSPHPLSAAKQSGTKAELMASSWKRMRNGLLLVDMPGYGHASRADWGDQIAKYLRQRRQLQRVFMLVDSEHGLKSTDMAMLERLVQDGVPHSLVFSKVDKLLDTNGKELTAVRLDNKVQKVNTAVEALKARLSTEIYAGRLMAGDLLCVSTRTRIDDGPSYETIGISALRHAILSACGIQHDAGLSKGLNADDIQILDQEPAIGSVPYQ